MPDRGRPRSLVIGRAVNAPALRLAVLVAMGVLADRVTPSGQRQVRGQLSQREVCQLARVPFSALNRLIVHEYPPSADVVLALVAWMNLDVNLVLLPLDTPLPEPGPVPAEAVA